MNQRLRLIDGIRGCAVVNMVAYHFLFDLFILQGFSPNWREIPAVHIWQQCICWTFLLVSGLSFHLGKNHWKNGAIINGCGLLITLITVLLVPEEAIWFGVLNLLGCSLWITALAEPVLKKIPPLVGGTLSFLLFLLTRHLQTGTLGLAGIASVRLPAAWYRFPALVPLGLPHGTFYSSDYFPLLPWLMLYLTGYFFGGLLLKRRREGLCRPVPGLDTVGRYSLIIYMLHQPAAMALSAAAALLLRA